MGFLAYKLNAGVLILPELIEMIFDRAARSRRDLEVCSTTPLKFKGF